MMTFQTILKELIASSYKKRPTSNEGLDFIAQLFKELIASSYKKRPTSNEGLDFIAQLF